MKKTKKESILSSTNEQQQQRIPIDDYRDSEKNCDHSFGIWKMENSTYDTGFYKNRPTTVYYLKCYCGKQKGLFRQFNYKATWAKNIKQFVDVMNVITRNQ